MKCGNFRALAILFLSFSINLLFLFSAHAETINVDGGCTLTQALTTADDQTSQGTCETGDSGADTIILPAGSYGLSSGSYNSTLSETLGFPVIDTEITIQGAGPSLTTIEITGGSFVTVMGIVYPGNLTLSGVTVQGGKASAKGGAGLSCLGTNISTRAQLTLSNVVLTNNSISGGTPSGAALRSEYCTGNYSDLYIYGNDPDGGNGSFYSKDSMDTLDDSTIANNISTMGNAGAGFYIDGAGTVLFNNVTVSGNVTGDYGKGGGGYINSNGTITFNHVTVYNNNSDEGHGIKIDAISTLNFNNSIFSSNNSGNDIECQAALVITSNGNNWVQKYATCDASSFSSDTTGSALTLNALATITGVSTLPTHLATDSTETGYYTPVTSDCSSSDENGLTRSPSSCFIGATEAGCGDGVIQSVSPLGEVCDNGAANSDSVTDACRTDCSAASCGDGVIDTGESCDDGNLIDGDGCSSSCATASCGDGTIDSGETCDDGGSNSNSIADACRDTCVSAYCGDSVVDSSESCDDGNTTSGDGCSATCVEESDDDSSSASCAITYPVVGQAIGGNSIDVDICCTGETTVTVNGTSASLSSESGVCSTDLNLTNFSSGSYVYIAKNVSLASGSLTLEVDGNEVTGSAIGVTLMNLGGSGCSLNPKSSTATYLKSLFP